MLLPIAQLGNKNDETHMKRSSVTQARKKVTLYEQLIRLQGKNNDQLLGAGRNI